MQEKNKYDYHYLVTKLNHYLKLKTIPIGMKRFKESTELANIPKLRRPKTKLNMDQVVGQSRWLGYTIGVTVDDLISPQCSAVVGLSPRNKHFLSGHLFNGVWFSSIDDSKKHQEAMTCAEHGEYESLAVSPLVSGRLGDPEICLIYATPGQMITLINGLQWKGYKKYSFTCVGESACADSWGNALRTGEPSLSIPCYAERKFGGVQDDELLIALPPSYLPRIVEGLEALSKNGLRYPIPNHGLDQSPLNNLIASYA